MRGNCRTKTKFWNAGSSNSMTNIKFAYLPDSLPNAGPVPCILLEEVTKTTHGMKNLKARGPDDLPANIWKLEEFSSKAANWLTYFFHTIVDFGYVPADWATSTTALLFKNKGDPPDCSINQFEYASYHTQ